MPNMQTRKRRDYLESQASKSSVLNVLPLKSPEFSHFKIHVFFFRNFCLDLQPCVFPLNMLGSTDMLASSWKKDPPFEHVDTSSQEIWRLADDNRKKRL